MAISPEEQKAFEALPREEQLDNLLREARFWLWSFEAPSSKLAQSRDEFVERVERVLNIQGNTYTVQR
jgi:hypothetical protein